MVDFDNPVRDFTSGSRKSLSEIFFMIIGENPSIIGQIDSLVKPIKGIILVRLSELLELHEVPAEFFWSEFFMRQRKSL